MKKIISLLVVVTLMAAFLVTSAFAAEVAEISVNEVNGTRGEEVTLEVSISGNPGFAASKITIEYDDTALELVGVDIAGKLMDGGVENDEKGIVSFSKATNVTEDGVLMTVTFLVKADAEEGEYAVNAVVSNLNAADRSDVEFTTVAGAVIVPHICEELKSHLEVPATCTEAGVKAYDECVACGKLYIDGVEVTEADLVIEATGHEFGEWFVSVEPTCTEKGEEKRECAHCDAFETRPVDATGHEFGEWFVSVEPTCTEKGEEKKECAHCDAFETRPVDATGHEFGEWFVSVEPTCTEKGEEKRECAHCDAFETRPVDEAGHVEGEWIVVKEPTATEKGLKQLKCLICGEVLAEEEIPALGDVPPTGDMIGVYFILAAVSVMGLVVLVSKKKAF